MSLRLSGMAGGAVVGLRIGCDVGKAVGSANDCVGDPDVSAPDEGGTALVPPQAQIMSSNAALKMSRREKATRLTEQPPARSAAMLESEAASQKAKCPECESRDAPARVPRSTEKWRSQG